MDACEPLLEGTRMKVDGEEIPLITMLEVLFSFEDCRSTVDTAQQKLSAMNIPKSFDSLQIHGVEDR